MTPLLWENNIWTGKYLGNVHQRDNSGYSVKQGWLSFFTFFLFSNFSSKYQFKINKRLWKGLRKSLKEQKQFFLCVCVRVWKNNLNPKKKMKCGFHDQSQSHYNKCWNFVDNVSSWEVMTYRVKYHWRFYPWY